MMSDKEEIRRIKDSIDAKSVDRNFGLKNWLGEFYKNTQSYKVAFAIARAMLGGGFEYSPHIPTAATTRSGKILFGDWFFELRPGMFKLEEQRQILFTHECGHINLEFFRQTGSNVAQDALINGGIISTPKSAGISANHHLKAESNGLSLSYFKSLGEGVCFKNFPRLLEYLRSSIYPGFVFHGQNSSEETVSLEVTCLSEGGFECIFNKKVFKATWTEKHTQENLEQVLSTLAEYNVLRTMTSVEIDEFIKPPSNSKPKEGGRGKGKGQGQGQGQGQGKEEAQGKGQGQDQGQGQGQGKGKDQGQAQGDDEGQGRGKGQGQGQGQDQDQDQGDGDGQGQDQGQGQGGGKGQGQGQDQDRGDGDGQGQGQDQGQGKGQGQGQGQEDSEGLSLEEALEILEASSQGCGKGTCIRSYEGFQKALERVYGQEICPTPTLDQVIEKLSIDRPDLTPTSPVPDRKSVKAFEKAVLLVNERNRKNERWYLEIQKLSGSLVADRPFDFRSSYTRPLHAHMGQDVIRPDRIPETAPLVLWLLDVSGSMDHEKVCSGLSCMKTYGVECDVIIFSSIVHAYLKNVDHNSALEEARKYSGGTDFRPPFEAVEKARTRYDGVIMVSDMEGPFPEKLPLKTRLMGLVPGNEYCYTRAVRYLPPWFPRQRVFSI